jgi:hypothetical protein
VTKPVPPLAAAPASSASATSAASRSRRPDATVASALPLAVSARTGVAWLRGTRRGCLDHRLLPGYPFVYQARCLA